MACNKSDVIYTCMQHLTKMLNTNVTSDKNVSTHGKM